MRSYTSYQRLVSDTIDGEILVVTTRYTTFDKAEMDVVEEIMRRTIGSGVMTEIEAEEDKS